MRDVIGYEEKDPKTMRLITSGYPRFVTHFYIRRIAAYWVELFGLKGREVFVVAAEWIAREAVASSEEPGAAILNEDGLWGMHVPAGSSAVSRVSGFLQHIGGGISSRRAERYLLEKGLITTLQHEERADAASAEAEVRQRTADLFGVPADHLLLASGGMSVFYAAFRAINEIQEKKGRTDWVQLGWLYVDTIQVLRKLNGGEHHIVNDVLDLAPLERLLQERGDRVAAIVTEVPTNPLIQTADLPRLRELANRFGVPLIIDPTLASPFNIDVLPHCDVAINSLTKYAASGGDVMMGAAVFNPASAFATEVQRKAAPWLIPPYPGDVQRLALEMRDYERVMQRINANTLTLTDFLEQHPSVEKVFGAYSGQSGKNYARLERRPGAPGGIISIKLRKPVAEFYDRVQVTKGPSFGVTFTILCPFLYLAHYDLVSTEEGRRYLEENNLDPELLRISVGTEDIDQILAAFRDAL